MQDPSRSTAAPDGANIAVAEIRAANRNAWPSERRALALAAFAQDLDDILEKLPDDDGPCVWLATEAADPHDDKRIPFGLGLSARDALRVTCAGELRRWEAACDEGEVEAHTTPHRWAAAPLAGQPAPLDEDVLRWAVRVLGPLPVLELADRIEATGAALPDYLAAWLADEAGREVRALLGALCAGHAISDGLALHLAAAMRAWPDAGPVILDDEGAAEAAVRLMALHGLEVTGAAEPKAVSKRHTHAAIRVTVAHADDPRLVSALEALFPGEVEARAAAWPDERLDATEARLWALLEALDLPRDPCPAVWVDAEGNAAGTGASVFEAAANALRAEIAAWRNLARDGELAPDEVVEDDDTIRAVLGGRAVRLSGSDEAVVDLLAWTARAVKGDASPVGTERGAR